MVTGGPGDDLMRGGTNGDDYSGGTAPTRRASATSHLPSTLTDGVDANLGAGNITTPDGPETASGIENVLGSAFDDTLRGTGGVDGLDGGPGNDTITGEAGATRSTAGRATTSAT